MVNKQNNFDIGVVNRFSWHKNHGDFAELYFRKNYFKGLDLSFRKIRKDKRGKKPDGYILDKDKNKIAVAEIKLIKSQNQTTNAIHSIKIDETITRAIKGAKKQLQIVKDDLPKVIYLILDDIFSKFKTVKTATFGKWITIHDTIHGTIYNGYSGLCTKYAKNNKLRDNLISAIVCYKKTQNSYKIYIIKNSDSIKLPFVLLDKKHLEEFWDYNFKRLKKSFPSEV
jgi:hypothetical protein